MSKCGRNSIPGLKEADAFTRGSAPLAMKMYKLLEDGETLAYHSPDTSVLRYVGNNII